MAGDMYVDRYLPAVLEQFEAMRQKGYRVIPIDRVQGSHLVEILSDDETVAVFHAGHGLVYGDRPASESNAWLSVYDGKAVAALDEALIARAKAALGRPYQASRSLKLFFTGACYGGLCEGRLRRQLQWTEAVTYFAAAGDKVGGSYSIGASLDSPFREFQLRPWVASLPTVGPATCASRFERWIGG